MTLQSQAFLLGKCTVVVSSGDSALLASLSRLFASTPLAGAARQGGVVVELDLDNPQKAFAATEPEANRAGSGLLSGAQPVSDLSLAIALITELAFRQHGDCLWIDAAALVSPCGQAVMLAGASMSGKTTLSTALSLFCGWKIVSEDICLLDFSSSSSLSLSVWPFVAPLSLRPGTKERLMKAGAAHIPLTRDEWFFVAGIFQEIPLVLPFQLCLLLREVDPEKPGTLSTSPLAPGDFLQFLMPLSNMVRKPDGMVALGQSLGSSRCYLLEGGNIAERKDELVRLSGTAGDASYS